MLNNKKDYKNKIKQGLDNGNIIQNKTNVKFKEGHIIGGVMADTQEELINIINDVLNRGDFGIPKCLQ